MGDFERFYNSALRFLSYRPRSEKEVRNRLQLKTQNSKLIDDIIQKLKEKKFINDEEFTKGWIENRNRFKPRSMRLIKLELKNKGIDPETIERLVAGRGSQVADDLENAKKLIEKKMGRFRNKFGMTPEKIYEKMGRFLASKGFNWDTIKKALDTALS